MVFPLTGDSSPTPTLARNLLPFAFCRELHNFRYIIPVVNYLVLPQAVSIFAFLQCVPLGGGGRGGGQTGGVLGERRGG